jgi:hypothetical protein
MIELKQICHFFEMASSLVSVFLIKVIWAYLGYAKANKGDCRFG